MLADWHAWILHAPPDSFWLWTGLLALLAPFSGFLALRALRRVRAIENTPTSKIRSAHQGYVELIGTCEPAADPLRTPLTGSPCAWYHCTVERYVRSGKHSRWKTVREVRSEAPLKLLDGTGECLIDPRGAEVLPRTRRIWYGNSVVPSGGAASGLRGIVGGSRYRYTEERIDAGDPLYALGEFVTLAAGDGEDLHTATGRLLRAWKQDPQTLLHRFDRDGDGRIDPQEWEAAREAARQAVLRERLENAGRPPLHTLGRSRDGRPFILSVHGQRALGRRYRWQALGWTCAFVLTAPAALWMLLVRLGSG